MHQLCDKLRLWKNFYYANMLAVNHFCFFFFMTNYMLGSGYSSAFIYLLNFFLRKKCILCCNYTLIICEICVSHREKEEDKAWQTKRLKIIYLSLLILIDANNFTQLLTLNRCQIFILMTFLLYIFMCACACTIARNFPLFLSTDSEKVSYVHAHCTRRRTYWKQIISIEIK